MALNIEGADLGYDANNLQTALNNLNIKCIEETEQQLRNGLAKLRQEVDNAWAGESAEKFKTKVEQDAETICKKIEEIGQTCTSSMNGFLSAMAEVDSNITF